MTKNKKLKNYLEAYPGATVEDYNNQRYSMIIIQATRHCTTKHVGSKSLKQLLALSKRG